MLRASQPTSKLHATLQEIAERYGTPCYAYDLSRLRAQVELIRTHLPPQVGVYYSLKANASLGISEVLRECGLGADVASAGELATAVEAGFAAEKIFVAGPYKSTETQAWLREFPEAIVSIDSPCELEQLTSAGLRNRAVLRLRPNFSSAATVAAGADSRFGFLLEQLTASRESVSRSTLPIIGFHVFAGSQVLSADNVNTHLQKGFDLALRAAELLRLELKFLDLGGGFGIPYRAQDEPLNLAVVGQKLKTLVDRLPGVRLTLELGRFFVAQAGWYLTRVVGEQTHGGRRAIVVDGGTHQRADLCGLCLRTKAAPPLVLSEVSSGRVEPTDILGCLSLPADIMAEACPLSATQIGDILAFANAGAYGLWASAVNFHGYPMPAEIAFDGDRIQPMRQPQPAKQILQGQLHITSETPDERR